MAMDEDFLSRFQNEARTIANLNHENLVKVYDIEHLYRTVFIIMEYLDGRSLLDILVEQQRLSPEGTLDILLQICRGLEVAHSQGIVHGDIKPGNIFIEKNNRAKLVDFGLACPMGTRSTRIVGTPKYFSPEAIRLGPVDERSDIYSLGLATYRIVTGEEAFFTADIANLCAMHLYEETPDPHKVMPNLPLELREFILKATRKSPEERFQNVGEIIHYLLPLSQRLGLDVGSDAKRKSHMMGLFVFYRDEQTAMIKRLVDDFSQELGKIGTELRQTDFKDV
jgi:serine/threonine protein kinase